jgi:pimeloyl-ACP methyl ester carboxylesterase
MPSLQVDGARIHYTDTGAPPGRPDAPTIVFGHGLLFSGWMFHPQVEALRARYRCVTIDWRGQGESPPARRGYHMDTLTADAVALIDSLGVAPVHYVGLSMGGFVGQRLGARHGRLLRSLVLLDTSPDREPPVAMVKDLAMAAVYPLLGVRPLRPAVLGEMFGPTFRHDPRGAPVIAEFLDRLARCDRRAIAKAVVGVVTRKPVHAELARISVPTLVIVGADDRPTRPDKARRIAAAVPGARLEIVADSGHSSTVEQPQIVTGLIESFLAALP